MKDSKVHSIVQIGLLSATITGAKLSLSFLPNVELVSFLLILFTVVFGTKKALLVSIVFTTTEILIYGFGPWIMGYYLIWPVLIVLTSLFKPLFRTEYHYALLSALFGLGFGFLFACYESLFYGIAYGFSYWIQGLGFDLLHMVSNYIVMVLLYRPILSVLNKLNRGGVNGTL